MEAIMSQNPVQSSHNLQILGAVLGILLALLICLILISISTTSYLPFYTRSAVAAFLIAIFVGTCCWIINGLWK